MNVTKGGDNLPDSYLEKRAEFLHTKEVRLQEQIANDKEVLQRRHDAINQSFRERSDRLRSWEKEAQRRHKEDRDLYASRRQHELDLIQQQKDRVQSVQQHYHDAAVSATYGYLTALEANIRRLGLDEDKPPASNQQASAVVSAKVEPLVANANRVAEIRRRKELDIAARRDKLQRQYVAQQQQMLASKDVVRLQQVQAVVSKAASVLISDREESLAARRRTIESDVNAQLNSVFLDGEKQRCLASFRETDKAFAVVAASKRAEESVAFTATRAQKAAQEEATKSTKRGALHEFFGAFLDELVGLAVDVSSRNFIQLTDGTTLRRLNPPTALEWRSIKEEALSTAAITAHIDSKKVAVARANTMSNASPRAKRSSSVNFGSFATAKPFSAPSSGGGVGIISAEFTSSMSLGEGSPRALLDDLWDTDEADHILEVVSERDKQQLVESIINTSRSTHKGAVESFRKQSQETWSRIVSTGAAKADKATTWWNNILTELPPTAVFVFGDPLSGVQLLSDARYIRDGDADYVITPDTLLPEILAAHPQQAQTEVSAPTVVSPTQGSGKGGKGGKAPAGGPRPSSAKPPSVVPSATGTAASAAPNDLAIFLSKRVAKHHRLQLEALAKRDNVSGYPPSLLLVGFPIEASSFAMEFNAALEKELEEEEKLWAPLKLLSSMEHNTPRGGGGGIGTHRSSIAGGQTNPNTPHGSLFSGAGGPGGAAPAAAASLGSGSPDGTPSLTASGPRHRPPPAAFAVSAGKHHAAALANFAATLFFAPARVTTVFLEVALPNLIERYQRIQRLVSPQAPAQLIHEVWAPRKQPTVVPGTLSLPPSTTASAPVVQSMWAGMTPAAAYEWVAALQTTWKASKQEWLSAVQGAHKRPPLPSATSSLGPLPGASVVGNGSNLNHSMASNSAPTASLVPSGLAPPVHACASRLTRVLHFVTPHTVDHLSTQDPIEVSSQILAQEVRALSKGSSQADEALVVPLLAPLTLQCFSIPESALEDLLAAHAAYDAHVTRWSLLDVLDSFDSANTSAFTPLSQSDSYNNPRATEIKVTVPDAILQRVEELRQGRIQSFRAMRELEIESGRCLHQAYLYSLCLLEGDAFTQVHAEYQRNLPADAKPGFHNQVFWKVCDAESSRVRSLLSNAVGILSNTIRRLQCAHVRTAMETITSAVEESTWTLITSVLEAERRRQQVLSLQGDVEEETNDDAGIVRSPRTAIQFKAGELVSLAAQLSSVVSEEQILEALEEVHEHGTPLESSLDGLWSKVERSWMVLISRLIIAATSGPSDDVASPFAHLEETLKAAVRGAFGTSAGGEANIPQQRIAPKSAQLFAPIMQHEQLRKHLSTGSTLWCSYLFQRTSSLLDRQEGVTLRPKDFSDIMIAPELPLVGEAPNFEEEYVAAAEARRALVISDVSLQHLSLHAQLASMSARRHPPHRSCWIGLPTVTQSQFEHMVLSAQISELHLHVPSSAEDIVTPLLLMLSNAATQLRSEGSDAQPPPRLFLPTWWMAPPIHTAAGNGGPKGALLNLELSAAAFRLATEGAVVAASEGSATVDIAIWLAHLCTGQLSSISFLRPGVADRVYHLEKKRCTTPNLLQLRQLVCDLDAYHRGTVPTREVCSWTELRWWPLLASGSTTTTPAPACPLILRQLYYLLGATDAPTSTRVHLGSILARSLTDVAQNTNLLAQTIRYLLSLSVSSGPSAVLEAAFAASTSLRGPLNTRDVVVAPQSINTVSHMKAFVSLDLIASTLALYHADWSVEDLEQYVVLTTAADTQAAPRSPKQLSSPSSAEGMERPHFASVPIKERSEEMTFASLNATHFGAQLLQLRSATTANCSLPSSTLAL
ncbi:Hypothetical protein, putative [Bodo saltans]|uniref:Uncharacterized protein n=1 Tax=Bodo saltans TaxID=75058 RepID=A0A0S4JPV0_BODSA|nr:Hypothetical protein, putative [Bodo saltans]|eukprot:CUG92202.1 Hypothetical protein, putative [Bodo saltans]